MYKLTVMVCFEHVADKKGTSISCLFLAEFHNVCTATHYAKTRIKLSLVFSQIFTLWISS